MKSSNPNHQQVRFYIDTLGRVIAIVPLFNGRGEARLLASDYHRLRSVGVKRWYANHNGKRRTYVVVIGLEGNTAHDGVARLITGAPNGVRVRYRDGDTFNLLPENLRLTEAVKGKERADTDHGTVMQLANAFAAFEDAARGVRL